MILTIPDTNAHLPTKAKVIDKPNSELQMIVRRALEQEELWTFFYAYQELDRRTALNPALKEPEDPHAACRKLHPTFCFVSSEDK